MKKLLNLKQFLIYNLVNINVKHGIIPLFPVVITMLTAYFFVSIV